jgi:hypothetical protein
MHFINARTLKLEVFSGEPPPYAILSHKCLSEAEEVVLGEFHDEALRKKKAGFRKSEWTCQRALEDGVEFAWVDTCCIDKSSSAELSEAINSMFKWYRASRVCYAYLDDVKCLPDPESHAAGEEQVVYAWLDAARAHRAIQISVLWSRLGAAWREGRCARLAI